VRDHSVFRVQQQRLLGRQMPVRGEPEFAVARAKLPKRGKPGRSIARRRVRPCRDQPALDDLAQKSLRQQTLAIGARELFRAEDAPAAALQLVQLLERGGELLV